MKRVLLPQEKNVLKKEVRKEMNPFNENDDTKNVSISMSDVDPYQYYSVFIMYIVYSNMCGIFTM